jgi:hypothetical protein
MLLPITAYGGLVEQWTVKSKVSSVAAYGSLLLPISIDHAL